MIRHLRGQLRSPNVSGTALYDGCMSCLDLRDFEVEDRVAAGGSSALGRAQHEANAPGGEECQIWTGAEEKLDAKHIPVEWQGRFDIADGKSNLEKIGEMGVGRGRHGRLRI